MVRTRSHSAKRCDVCTSPFSPAPVSRSRGLRRAASSPGGSPLFQKQARTGSPASGTTRVTASSSSGSPTKSPTRAEDSAKGNTEELLTELDDLLKPSPPGRTAGQNLTRDLVSLTELYLGEEEDSTFSQCMRLLDKFTEVVQNYNSEIGVMLKTSTEAAIKAQAQECEMEEHAEAGGPQVHKDTPYPTPDRIPEMLREESWGAMDMSLNGSYGSFKPAGFSDDSDIYHSDEDSYLQPECGRCGGIFDHYRARSGIPWCLCRTGDSGDDAEAGLSRLEDLHL